MSNYILLSHILDENTPSYGGIDKLIIEQPSRITEGGSANSSKWTFSNNHIGTHVDVPRHFYDSGKTITDYDPREWIFKKIQIIDVPCKKADLISKEAIEFKIRSDIDLLLIRTGYEKYRSIDKYWDDNPGLTPELGFWLRKNCKSIRAIGFDFISLTSWRYRDIGKEAHRVFLNPKGSNQPIWIIEDMSLISINNEISEVIIAPLFINKSNGSPVTIFGYQNFESNKL